MGERAAGAAGVEAESDRSAAEAAAWQARMGTGVPLRSGTARGVLVASTPPRAPLPMEPQALEFPFPGPLRLLARGMLRVAGTLDRMVARGARPAPAAGRGEGGRVLHP